MGLLEMSGSYPLDDAAIDAMVRRTSPGNYALGYLDGDTFLVFYVGRSDSDVGGCLHEWVDAPSHGRKHAAPAQAAWGLRHRAGLPVDAPARGRVEAAADSYTRFAYSYATSPAEAFAQEWRNYDDFGGSAGLDNPDCPEAAPDGSR